MGWLAPVTMHLQANAAAQHVLCGHLQICTHWREHEVDPAEPSWVRVPIKALGRASSSSTLSGPVAYLAMEDADVFIIVWRLPSDAPEMGHDELYSYCQRVMREAPPADNPPSDTVGEPRQVVLPRFSMQVSAAASIPKRIVEAGNFGHPCELLAARLSTRLPPRGVLSRHPRRQEPGSVLKMDGSFVLCVWHAHVDDLEVPIFAMVVRPIDWNTSG